MEEITIEKTVHNTIRVFISRQVLDRLHPTNLSILQIVLGAWAIWGNFDINTEEFLSWEFDISISEEQLRMVISRLIH